jgi:CRISPR/Cas system CMR-associated protein Cmr3 (group 5 of RAMP superfamily)
MANYAEYFAARDADLPKPKYNYGDRVFGRWNKVPFIGSVVREQNKNLLIQVDLPIKHKDNIHNILHISRLDVTLLKDYDTEETDRLQRKTTRG